MKNSNRFLIVSFCLAIGLFFSIDALAQRNVAEGKPVKQSSVFQNGNPSNAVDGNTDGNWRNGSVTHTQKEIGPWWEVDLEKIYNISDIVITNREDCCQERIEGATIFIRNTTTDKWRKVNVVQNPSFLGFVVNMPARYVRIVRVAPQPVILSLAEVSVFTNDLKPKELLPTTMTFKNEGGYVARYTLIYKVKGQPAKTLETGDVLLGQSKTYEIPAEATGIRVMGKAATGLIWEPWKEIFNKAFQGKNSWGFDVIKTYGTIFDPKHAH